MTQNFYIVPRGITRRDEMVKISTDYKEIISSVPGDFIVVSEEEARSNGGIEAFIETQKSWTGAWTK